MYFLQEKESLITELRKELRLSNEEHRDLLNKVNAEETIRQIRCFTLTSFSWKVTRKLFDFLNEHLSVLNFLEILSGSGGYRVDFNKAFMAINQCMMQC